MPLAPENLDASAVALFLDVDGTLLEIRDNPAEVVADRALTELLQACSKKVHGALSLISGRSIAEVDRIFAPAVFPVAGAHGAELRFDGAEALTLDSNPMPREALRRLEEFVAANPSLLLEYKRGGVSLHYRRAPELQAACGELVRGLMADLGDAFRLIAGKMVYEIAPAAHNKGAAIRAFPEHAPFAGRIPVYVGDDVTDEDAFAEVNRVDGLSIRVGDSAHSQARYELPDVASVRPWLGAAVLGITQTTKREGNGLE
jgi:trehalose 6-phosphate phosphatase